MNSKKLERGNRCHRPSSIDQFVLFASEESNLRVARKLLVKTREKFVISKLTRSEVDVCESL